MADIELPTRNRLFDLLEAANLADEAFKQEFARQEPALQQASERYMRLQADDKVAAYFSGKYPQLWKWAKRVSVALLGAGVSAGGLNLDAVQKALTSVLGG